MIFTGFGLRPYNLGPDALMIISYPGELFMRLLKLMILPLIIASLIAGSASLNARMSGKIAVRTLLYFILTSMFNAFLGISLAMLIHPGQPDLKDDSIATFENKRDHSILDSLLDIGRFVQFLFFLSSNFNAFQFNLVKVNLFFELRLSECHINNFI